MRVFRLCEVSDNPKQNDNSYSTYDIFNNELYFEAECNVDCNLTEEVSDEEFDKLVEEELENILETLKTKGRYPETGVPKYVAY